MSAVTLPAATVAVLRAEGWSAGPWRQEVLTGGCIAQVVRLHDGPRRAVAKVRADAPDDLFAIEAESLRDLGHSLPVPAVLGQGPGWLLLEDVGDPADDPDDEDPAWLAFADAFARLHRQRGPAFGYHHDTYWGLVRYPNAWTTDGAVFYARQRYAILLDHPGLARHLDVAQRHRVARLAERLGRWCADQPPVLNHGDCWSGNRLAGPRGLVAIDPFIHYGWAVCDLHNHLMFGGFPPAFFQRYAEQVDLPTDWRDRAEAFFSLHLIGMLAQDIDVAESGPWLQRLLDKYLGE